MTPIFFTVGNDRAIKVIPNTQAEVNGHPVLTYTYNIYNNGELNEEQEHRQESELLLETKTDPTYLGFITFEDPGKLFTYTADGYEELTSHEVEEIIENISHYRDQPGLWSI
ncbi:hypothetical protein [Mucilaginibacter phyllosphaerae]|uniref:Uncharacterized protein n=1 Tax=Mucilaginibacter phyllosphaerae TaxID=1812349 RepID=A0A4Y8AGU8_9SPHI|nr:hypothetical protein [Mucilaginibacter phyllosphaerae]MBB3968409.1 hypothetical protein [Mucilaginibacter phyllosphaerae]TEW67943.1 hypothetical protein E2R65_08120 [Mucilaginibacter phyllosphaerae]GGH16177.1 hypothetical protein GCM10007352_25410 [Mucilaginibacter phyllosphaerae]